MQQVAHRQKAQRRPLGVDLLVFEPQPQFVKTLGDLASHWNGTHYAAAAWTEDTTLSFMVSTNSEASSLVPSIALSGSNGQGRAAAPTKLQVRALNLATFMRDTVSVRDAQLILCKLDVEAAEFELLPHLLARGTLCHVDFLLIEWHLNALPEERRLAGLGLRLSLAETLRRGCPQRDGRPPPKVQHADDPANNLYVNVPGLREELQKHEMPSASSKGYSKAEALTRKWAVSHDQAGRSSSNRST